jgi:ATP-dependent DNA helicase DinG
MRAAIKLAGGREVCFACTVDAEGVVLGARVVSRGTVQKVLALPRAAEPGEMLVHNHPSGLLEPSDADLGVAARLYEGGIGFGIVDNAASELYVVVEVPKQLELTPLDRRSVDRTSAPTARSRPRCAATRTAEPARDGVHHRRALQRRRRRALEAGTGWASRSATCCPRCAGPPPTASARWSRRTRSTCRSS